MAEITLEQVRNFHKGCARLDLPEIGRPMAWKEHLAFADAIDAAIKQREQDKRDAARYRWLADSEDGDLFMENAGKDALDAAIDAARTKESGNG